MMLTMDEIAVDIEQFFLEREPNWTEQEIALARIEFLLSSYYDEAELIRPEFEWAGQTAEAVLHAQLVEFAMVHLGWSGFGEDRE